MGQYLNPPKELQNQGRVIKGEEYQELVDQLQPDELLFALLDRGPFIQAPYLFCEEEFEEFRDVRFKSRTYFALDANVASQYKIKPVGRASAEP